MAKRKGLKSIIFAVFALGLAFLALVTRQGYALSGFDPTLYASQWNQDPSGTSVSGGNIYNATFSVAEQTYRWAALWGNVTGSIVLRTADGSQLISWIIEQVQNESVIYATTNDGTLNPSNFNSFSNANLQNTDTAYGYDVDVTDSITNTYTGVANFQSPSMNSPVVANTTILQATWTNYVFRFNSSEVPASYPGGRDYVVWAVETVDDQASFYGGLTADYQLLIPENQEVGQGKGTPTTYYFWMEFK